MQFAVGGGLDKLQHLEQCLASWQVWPDEQVPYFKGVEPPDMTSRSTLPWPEPMRQERPPFPWMPH